MLMLSSMDVWLLHSIISMFLWITFIGLVLLILGFAIYTVEKLFMGTSEENDNNNDKGDKNNV